MGDPTKNADRNARTVGARHGYGRLRGAGRSIVRSAVAVLYLVCLVCLGTRPGAAEPPNPTTIVVFGDSQAAGLASGLQRVLVENQRYRVLNRTHTGAALVNGEREWLEPISRFLSREKADVAVVMVGANDRLDLRDDQGGSLRFRTDEWRKVYAARADKILTTLAKAGLKVIWCGNPIARSENYSADMTYLNDIFAGEAARSDAQFVSLWDVVADDQGHYTAYGKDRHGTTQRLRADDGNHFTVAGYEVIAEKIVGLLSATGGNAR